MNKNIMLTAAIAASTLVSITGCKDEKIEEPQIPLEERILGDWNVNSYKLNGSELNTFSTPDGSTYAFEMDFDADGDFLMQQTETYEDYGQTYTYVDNYTGSWTVENEKLIITYDDSDGLTSEFIQGYIDDMLPDFNVENYDVELDEDDLSLDGEFGGVDVKIEATKE